MLLFEDALTIQYQVQEMLRVERIFEPRRNRGRTGRLQPADPGRPQLEGDLLIEFPDALERARQLARLKGIEDAAGCRSRARAGIWPSPTRTSSGRTKRRPRAVHFLRFELDPAMIANLRAGAGLAVGIDHPQYQHVVDAVSQEARSALAADFA